MNAQRRRLYRIALWTNIFRDWTPDYTVPGGPADEMSELFTAIIANRSD
jgi:hypothetical protein